MFALYLIFIGFAAGLCGGFFGIGGGIIIVPLLAYFLGVSQKLSQGITLGALLFPIALPAVISYWKFGNTDIKASIFIALGFVVGGYFGGSIAQCFSDLVLRRAFAILLISVAIKMLLDK